MTITQPQLARLEWIAQRSAVLWNEMRDMERQAYEITKEEDLNGYTSDLIWQSDAKVATLLEVLNIEVEESNP